MRLLANCSCFPLGAFAMALVATDDTTRRFSLIAHILEAVGRSANGPSRREVTEYALRLLKTSDTHHEALGNLCEGIANEFFDDEEWRESATWLAKIPLAKRSAADQLRLNLRMTQLYLELDDLVAAEAAMNRAANVHGSVTDPMQLTLYGVCWARVLDCKREFDKAFARYYQSSFRDMQPDEVVQALESAVICAILAKPGAQRSRALGSLYKDERVAQTTKFAILEKMFLRRIVTKAEVARFAAGLKPHHLAITSDGSTVLERAVIEHNLFAAAQIYNNISFVELGNLLAITPERAERIAASMIARGAMQGVVDQMAGFVIFSEPEALQAWDSHIEGLCADVNSLSATLPARFPELYPA